MVPVYLTFSILFALIVNGIKASAVWDADQRLLTPNKGEVTLYVLHHQYVHKGELIAEVHDRVRHGDGVDSIVVEDVHAPRSGYVCILEGNMRRTTKPILQIVHRRK